MISRGKTVSLVLIGSALFLAGCRRSQEEEERRAGVGGRGHVGVIPIIRGGSGGVRSGGGGGISTNAGGTARGGFGSFGGGAGS